MMGTMDAADGLDLPPMAEYDIACHTGGCENEGHVIRVWATETNPSVVCGPCGQVIADIVLVSP